MKKNLLPNQFEYAGIYVEGQRSSFSFKKPVATSFMSGMLVPLGDPIPVFPGTKLALKVHADIRTNTLVVPPLDPMFIDFVATWVPHRIVWNHMPQFLGENDQTAWTQNLNLVYPYVELGEINDPLYDQLYGYEDVQSDVCASNLFLAPQFGLFYGAKLQTALGVRLPSAALKINVLAIRGYYAVWNYLFRDENYQRPVLFSKGDDGDAGEFGYFVRDYKCGSEDTYIDDIGLSVGDAMEVGTACLMPVNKFHDAFTSMLPQPQFGDAVEIPLGTDAPLMLGDAYELAGASETAKPTILLESIRVNNSDGEAIGYTKGQGTTTSALKTNLHADLFSATATTVNTWRTSVMYQRYLEALARGGRRVPEYYDVIYNVKNSTAQKDYPELLTHSRYILGVNQVVATADASGDGWTSRLGDTGAYSLTKLRDIPVCEKDFTEFGYLHIDFCVRAGNRYSTFVQPHFLRSKLLDEYNPYFDHIGEVGIHSTTMNVFAQQDTNAGYQEAWWDERTQLAMANGCLNKKYGSLKYWILGENLGGLSAVTPAFLCFNPSTLDDVFVSEYCTYPQFIIDAVIFGKKVARMSLHSTPGIVGRI